MSVFSDDDWGSVFVTEDSKEEVRGASDSEKAEKDEEEEESVEGEGCCAEVFVGAVSESTISEVSSRTSSLLLQETNKNRHTMRQIAGKRHTHRKRRSKP
jgi:hypothetical protein